MSYIYFDINGRLREYVTTPKRKGSENVDTLCVYWEGNDGTVVLPSQCFIEYGHESIHAGPLTANKISRTIIPFERERDLRFFQYGKTYQFMCFDLPTAVSSTSGFWHSSVSIHDRLTDNVVQVLGDITFEVEESSIVPSGNLDLSQYNYLLDAIRENRIIYDSKGNVSARFTDSGLQITGSSLTLNDETWGFTKVSKKGTDGTKRSVGMLLFNFLYDSGISVDLGSALLLTDTRQVFALGDEDIEYLELSKGELVVSEETANYLTTNRVDLSSIPDWIDERYVKKLGAGSNYRVYMVNPSGIDTYRVASSSAVGEVVALRTSTGQLELPDQAQNVPGGRQAISKDYADDKYILDQKTTDFHPTTTLRWLNANGNREMVINGSWIGFYAGGYQLLTIRGDSFTYLDKTVKWCDLADIKERYDPTVNAVGKLQSDWEFLDKVAEKTFSKAFTEVKPGRSGIPSSNATVNVTATTWQKKIDGAIVGYKTIVDVTCRCEQFDLKDVGFNVLLSEVGSRWFMPRMAVSRGNIGSAKFTKMMDRLNAQKDRVGILVDEVSVFRDATTNLGALNVSGVISGQVAYDYAEFRVFAIMLELDKDNKGKAIPCTGAHYRIVLYHPETIL